MGWSSKYLPSFLLFQKITHWIECLTIGDFSDSCVIVQILRACSIAFANQKPVVFFGRGEGVQLGINRWKFKKKKNAKNSGEPMLDSLEIRHKDYVFRGEKKKGGLLAGGKFPWRKIEKTRFFGGCNVLMRCRNLVIKMSRKWNP